MTAAPTPRTPAKPCCARCGSATRSRTPSAGCCRPSDSGCWHPGESLPPERELAARLGVSRDTVREAIKSLADAGYLVSRRGRYGGTFLADELPRACRTTRRGCPARRSTTRCGCGRSSRSGAARMAATPDADRRRAGGAVVTAERRPWRQARGLPPAGLPVAPGHRGGGRVAVAGAAGGREPDAAQRAAGSDPAAAPQHRAFRRAARGDRHRDPGRRRRGCGHGDVCARRRFGGASARLPGLERQ